MRRTLSVCVILLGQLACRGPHVDGTGDRATRAPTSETAPDAAPPQLFRDRRGIVVGRSRAAEAPFHKIDWEPSLKEVDEFETVLDRDLPGKLPAVRADLARRVRGYKREYFGVSDNGRHIMVVDMFCTLPSDWPSKLYGIPPDGGSCYLTVGYDPSQKTLLFVSLGQTE